jgi:hypothetical protein
MDENTFLVEIFSKAAGSDLTPAIDVDRGLFGLL